MFSDGFYSRYSLSRICVYYSVFRMRFFLTNRVYSVEKAKHLLGYKPIVPMDVAIDRTVEWLKQLDSDNAKSSSGKNIKKNA